MNGTANTEQLPDPLAFALGEILATVNGVDPVERDAEYEDCSDEELHIHKQLGRIRALISQIQTEAAEAAVLKRLVADLPDLSDAALAEAAAKHAVKKGVYAVEARRLIDKEFEYRQATRRAHLAGAS